MGLSQGGELSAEQFVIETDLPREDWTEFWTRIYVDEQDKEKIVNYGLLLRQFQEAGLDRMTLSHHGIILLSGPPGTGKTSLAKGAANEIAKQADPEVVFKRIEVQHLFSGSLGDTPKLVEQAFQEVIEPARNPEYNKYQVLLLDEVESLFSSRSMLSGDTDPMDSVRAVNTALESIDELANLPGVYVIATSNQPQAVDRAYYDRTDDQIYIGNPEAKHRGDILIDIFQDLNDSMGTELPTEVSEIKRAVELSEGFSGRRLRKTVLAAISREVDTVTDPSKLTYEQVLDELKLKYRRLRQQGSSDYIDLGNVPERDKEGLGIDEEQTGDTPVGEATSKQEQNAQTSSARGSPKTTSDVGRANEPTEGVEASEPDKGTAPGPEEVSESKQQDTTEEQPEPQQADETDSPKEEGDSEAPQDWLDPRVVVYDTTESNPHLQLETRVAEFFTGVLKAAGHDNPEVVSKATEESKVEEVLYTHGMRRTLKRVSATVDGFTIDVNVDYAIDGADRLNIPSEAALPSVDDAAEVTLTLYVDADVEDEDEFEAPEGVDIELKPINTE